LNFKSVLIYSSIENSTYFQYETIYKSKSHAFGNYLILIGLAHSHSMKSG
jgi:hypothetical protein